MSDDKERKKDIIEISLHPETIEGIEGEPRKCVDENEAFNVLEKIRDLLIYLQTLDIEGSEERSMKYDMGIETAIQSVEEAQEAVSC
jgi:hypothetical protein